MSTEPNSEFTANRDMVDSLKLEASNIPPRLESNLRMVAKKAARILVNRYRQFIPDSTIISSQGLENRILNLDPQAFNAMRENWDIISNSDSLNESTLGTLPNKI